MLRMLDGEISTQFLSVFWIKGDCAFPTNKLCPFYKLFSKTFQTFTVIFRFSCQSCWEVSWYLALPWGVQQLGHRLYFWETK